MTGRRPWGPKFEAELRAFIEARKTARCAPARDERRHARAQLLATLQREVTLCIRLSAYADESVSPNLFALGRLAMHYHSGGVQFEGVRFPVRRSVHGGVVLHPDSGDELVMFLW